MSFQLNLRNFDPTGQDLTEFEITMDSSNRFYATDGNVYFYVRGPQVEEGTHLFSFVPGDGHELKYGTSTVTALAISNPFLVQDGYATRLINDPNKLAYFAIGMSQATYDLIVLNPANKLWITCLSLGNIFDQNLINALGNYLDQVVSGAGSTFTEDNFKVTGDLGNPTAEVSLSLDNLETGEAVVLDVPGNSGTINVITDDTKEKTGFAYPDQVVVTYDPTNRTITLTGNTLAYFRGKRLDWLVSGWVSPAHDIPSGSYFLYSTDGLSADWSNTPWSFDHLMIALAFRDTANFCLRECHGLMDHLSHAELHSTVGTHRRTSGNPISGITVSDVTPVNRRPTIASMTIWDEDLPTTNAVLTKGTGVQYTQMKLTGAGTTNFVNTAATTDFIKSDSDIGPIYWNQFNGANWVDTAFLNNQYGKVFVVAVPVTADAECQKSRYLFVQPQQVSTTLSVIQAVTPASINWGHINNSLAEFVVVGEIIVRYSTGGSGNWVVISTAEITGTRLAQLTVSGLTSVSTDESLAGVGTGASPLYVQRSGMKNYFVNGCLRRWQASTGSAVTNNTVYHADQWKSETNGSTDTVSQRTDITLGTIPGDPKYYVRHELSGNDAAGDYVNFFQHIESVRTLAGEQFTISFWAKAVAAGTKIGVDAVQRFGGGGSADVTVPNFGVVTLTTSWAKYSITGTMPSIAGKTIGTDDNVYVRLWLSSGTTNSGPAGCTAYQNTTIDLTMLQIERGANATDFEWDNEAVLDKKCRRFYIGQGTFPATTTYSGETGLTFALSGIAMRKSPILTGGRFHKPGVAFYNVTPGTFGTAHGAYGENYGQATIAAGAGAGTSGQIDSLTLDARY